jgi:hypothetical protein
MAGAGDRRDGPLGQINLLAIGLFVAASKLTQF